MTRIISVWLPQWRIWRFLKQAPPDERPAETAPFVLAKTAAGGPRIAALNATARTQGLKINESVADARARVLGLNVRDADFAADDAALKRLVLWAMRWSPSTALYTEDDGGDGLFIDITGAGRIHGGETRLIADIRTRLARFGLQARCAIADTAGAAWAIAHAHDEDVVIVPEGATTQALAVLSIAALRLPDDMILTLHQLGFRTIGSLMDKPRAPFAARFEKLLLRRLDEALGKRPEPLRFIMAPPVWRALRQLPEPIFTQEAIVAEAKRLMLRLSRLLIRHDMGARTLKLDLFRLDGERTSFTIRLARPSHDPDHIAKLIALRLERGDMRLAPGFGFETVSLTVTKAESLRDVQKPLATLTEQSAEDWMQLVDRLRQKLGDGAVHYLAPFDSHIPERAEQPCADAVSWRDAPSRMRPLLMLGHPAQVDVLGDAAGGLPQVFHWQGSAHRIAHLEGPERITPEWWRDGKAAARDYYRVEDRNGRRYWLFREKAQWFLHGIFP